MQVSNQYNRAQLIHAPQLPAHVNDTSLQLDACTKSKHTLRCDIEPAMSSYCTIMSSISTVCSVNLAPESSIPASLTCRCALLDRHYLLHVACMWHRVQESTLKQHT